jgi:hypothetical protein
MMRSKLDRVGIGRSLRGLAVLAVTLVLGGVARALPPCPTWFPDFRCDRHGRYDGFVPPMMHPYLFEDPFITTGLNAVGLWHQFPSSSILDGGHLWDAALQARIAITDRIAFIATKDGWVDFDPHLKILKSDSGITDITLGLKGALIDDRKDNLILTPSLRFQIPIGQRGVLQGNGNGVFIPDLSFGWGIDRFHVLADFGGQFPLDTNDQSTSLFYHLHLDYAVHRFFVPFAEIGGFHYLDGGNGNTPVTLTNGMNVPIGTAQTLLGKNGEEGYDYANLGSPGVAGENVVAWSVGVRVPVNRHLIFGAAYERPLTQRKDVLSQRAQVQVTLEY